MLAHEEVWAAIDGLASRNGLSPSGLARRSGLDPTTFNKSKRYAPDGRPRWPSTESIAKILRATNTSVSEFFGQNSRPVDTSNGVAVPLLGEAHAGVNLTRIGAEDPIMLPRPARIITFPDTRYEPLYALSVVGESMLPLYRNGDVLFVAPNASITVGDRVVVKLSANDIVVKILKAHTVEEYAFQAINPEHPDIAVATASVEWIARIVYATQ